MYDKNGVTTLLEKLGSLLKPKVTVYLIGGGNMGIKGLKAVTKDVDFVVMSRKDLNALKPSLEQLGLRIDEQLFKDAFYQDAVLVFQDASGSRLDFFVKSVSNQLALSEAMRKRSKEHAAFGNLKVMLVSNEDLFLLKSMTDRPQDVDDCLALLETGLDWSVILQECVAQHRQDAKWVFWLYEQLCRIEEAKNLVIPEKSEVFSICAENWGKRPEDFMWGFSKEQVRKHIPVKYQDEVLEGLKELERR